MSKRKIFWSILGVIVVVVVGIQLIPYGRNHTNPPVVTEPQWDSPRTRELFTRACADCHSNETVWPWYSNLAPMSWLVLITMAPAKPSKKPATHAPGVKLLITAASLAATLGGWAVISAKEPKPTAAPVSAQVTAPVVTINLAPLPTLVPPITLQPRSQLVTIDQPRPAAAAAAPQSAAPTELVLRDVSAPQVNAGGGGSAAPAPAVNTGSSR